MNLAKMTSCMEPLATLEIDGQGYEVRALSVMAMGRLQRIIDQKPDPMPWRKVKVDLDELKAAGAIEGPAYQVELVEAVRDSQKWPPQLIYDGRANAMMTSDPECLLEMVASSFGVPREKAATLADKVPFAVVMRVMRSSMGVDEETDDPKAGA